MCTLKFSMSFWMCLQMLECAEVYLPDSYAERIIPIELHPDNLSGQYNPL